MKTMKEIISYVRRTYAKYTTDFVQAVRDLKLEELSELLPPQDTTDVIAMERWKYRLKEHKTKVLEYSNFKVSLYSVVHSQCTDAFQEKLKSHPNFDSTYKNGIELLKIIKLLLYSNEQTSYQYNEVLAIKESFNAFKQGNNMSLQRYHELFLYQLKVLEEIVGGKIADDELAKVVAQENRRKNGVPTSED